MSRQDEETREHEETATATATATAMADIVLEDRVAALQTWGSELAGESA